MPSIPASCDGRNEQAGVQCADRLRGMDVGTAMLSLLVPQAARRGLERCYLHAQSQAVSLYRRHGIEIGGKEFMEGMIPHRRMHIRK